MSQPFETAIETEVKLSPPRIRKGTRLMEAGALAMILSFVPTGFFMVKSLNEGQKANPYNDKMAAIEYKVGNPHDQTVAQLHPDQAKAYFAAEDQANHYSKVSDDEMTTAIKVLYGGLAVTGAFMIPAVIIGRRRPEDEASDAVTPQEQLNYGS